MPATKEPTKTTKKASSVKQYHYGTGKRKTAIARVRLYKNGKGDLTVNDKEGQVHFPLKKLISIIESPLKLTSCMRKFNITVRVTGGGIVAQAEAIRHGISRALLRYDESFRISLKKAGFLTRDPRVKERKKPGLKKARRAPQFSKR